VAVEVRDAGAGIALGELGSVFEPFRTTRKDGLGLGLPICRSIVEAHGGAIGVEPNPGRGVTFRFELPAEAGGAVEEAPDPALDAQDLPRIASATGPLVCIVDDDATVRESLARLCAAQGWGVAAYASAEEFLARQPPGAVGCMLLDHQMPGMSGLELQQELARRGAAPPIVFLTGHGELAAGVHAMKLGALDFLAKPADAGVLVEVVRRALGRAREREALAARLGRLSAREREVMEHVLRGRLNKQIAADMDIAIQTVKQHRGRVMEKMEVRSVAELAKLCAGLEPAAEREV
jgi:FixJ family two-component response regulator